MNKPKILKEIGFFYSNVYILPFFKKEKVKAFQEDELKQEAIKWIKYLNDKHKGTESIQEWIMNFFDIAKGELNE
jgi:hypothetical protein